MLVLSPTLMEISSSVALRWSVCSWFRYVFFTNCWVMVDPLCVSPPCAIFRTARAMPIGSTPESVSNEAFSAAITAFCIDWGICESGTICRLSSPPPATTIVLPSAQ